MKSRNVLFIKTPSKPVSLPANKPDNISGMDNVGIISVHDVQEDHDMMRDVRDYTHPVSTTTTP